MVVLFKALANVIEHNTVKNSDMEDLLCMTVIVVEDPVDTLNRLIHICRFLSCKINDGNKNQVDDEDDSGVDVQRLSCAKEMAVVSD